MLSQKQIEKLQVFLTSQKYGKLIEAAIETWKQTPFKFGEFGIYGKNVNINEIADQNEPFPSIAKQKYDFENDDKKCCLIGAALVGKERIGMESYTESINRIYGNDLRVNFIYSGFDYKGNDIDLSTNAEDDFTFGNIVRNILLNKE